MEKIIISTAKSHFSKDWQKEEISLKELSDKLSKPIVTDELYDEFMSLPREEQSKLKNVGGYMAGELDGRQRKNDLIKNRSLIAFDADNIKDKSEMDSIIQSVKKSNYNYILHSTRKHSSKKPRLRILISLDRYILPEEYEPLARKVADNLNILNTLDTTTFQAVRLMYWPSCSLDSDFEYYSALNKNDIVVDEILGLYKNWRDTNEWPVSSNEDRKILKLVNTELKQKNPLEKSGIVGAFCRSYTIHEAIENFLSDIYEAGTMQGRYTLREGESSNGVVTYNDIFSYSYHNHDAAKEKLCNAFDLVRIHRFGDLDKKSKATKTEKLPSFLAMSDFVKNDSIAGQCFAEMQTSALEDFEDDKDEDPNGIKASEVYMKLAQAKFGPARTIRNYEIILDQDKKLKSKIYLNEFTNRIMISGTLLGNKASGRDGVRPYIDSDTSSILSYCEKVYSLKDRPNYQDALLAHTRRNKKHPVREYLNSLDMWDGVPRVNTLLVDYLGAEDTAYTHEITRKTLLAAVSRILSDNPIKFDYMTILIGGQGIGKSTLIRKLAIADEWYNDSIPRLVDCKEVCEKLQGSWLVEVGELAGLRKAETDEAKQFLSKTIDTYRPSYARNAESFRRQCIFIGSTNEGEFLKDKSGNRRYWPIECFGPRTKNVYKIKGSKNIMLDDEVNQIWSEVMYYYRQGEDLDLSEEIKQVALKKQAEHVHLSEDHDRILDFILKPVPKDWDDWDTTKRKAFWDYSDSIAGAPDYSNIDLVPRYRISAQEIRDEFLYNDREYSGTIGLWSIGETLKSIDGLKYDNKACRSKGISRRRYFIIDWNVLKDMN